MPRAIDISRRRQAVEAYEQGEGTLAEIAARYGVSEPSLRRWRNRVLQTGTLEPSVPTRHGPKPMLDQEDRLLLRQLVESKPGIRLNEVVERFCARSTKKPSMATVRRALVSMGLTRNGESAPASTDIPSLSRRRASRNARQQPGRVSYPSDISDLDWTRVQSLLEEQSGSTNTNGAREILDALSYLSRTGCPWPYLPHDLPAWESVLARYQQWWQSGMWDRINQQLSRPIQISSRADP